MKLTRQTNYALRILMYCDAKNDIVTIAEVSRYYGLPLNFMTKVLYSLSKSGFVKATRGRGGGVRLAFPAEEIRLSDVVREIESNFEMAECFKEEGTECPLIEACGLNLALSRALASFFNVLSEYTIRDLTHKRFIINDLNPNAEQL